MRSLQLQAALTDHLQAVSALLQRQLAEGAEVPFELERHAPSARGAGPELFAYHPLTDRFLDEHELELERLDTFAAAISALVGFDGVERYLAELGLQAGPAGSPAAARAALRALQEGVFAEQTDFELRPERLRSAFAALERSTVASVSGVTIVATLQGLMISSAELRLANGLTIAHPDAIEGLPTAAVRGEGPAEPHLLVVLSLEADGPSEGFARGRAVLRDLLRALRLFGDGRVTLGPLAWGRLGDFAWSPVALGEGGRPHGMLVVTPAQEDELRAFCNLVSRRAPHENELAWALRRFELACGREDPYEALSDNLLALRALLEPAGGGEGLLAPRLAALCATPERRAQLCERVRAALELEQAAIAGSLRPHAGARTLAEELADHLRALLRDVICGHLDGDLIGLADELLSAEAAERAATAQAAPEQPLIAAQRTAGAQPPAAAQDEPAPAPPRQPRFVARRLQESAEQELGDAGEPDEILDLFI